MIWLLLAVGALLTALGVLYGIATAPPAQRPTSLSNMLAAGILGSLGAGIVGAVLSIAITRLTDRAGREAVLDLVARSLESRFVSDAADIENIRRDWHHYHVTGSDGVYQWHYQVFAFSQSAEVNAIRLRHALTDRIGRPFVYGLEAGMRGSQGIVLLRGQESSGENTVVEVFPTLGHAFRSHHCGVGFYRNWSGQFVTSRIILSDHVLVPADELGAVDVEHEPTLDEMWRRTYTDFSALFPEVGPVPTDATR